MSSAGYNHYGRKIRDLWNRHAGKNIRQRAAFGLGCEKLQSELPSPEGTASASMADSDIMRMQDERLTGFGEIVSSIVEMADKRPQVLNRRRDVRPPHLIPSSAAG
jgi:altronate dehydratase